MSTPRFLYGLAILGFSLPLCAQTPPTAYTITQAVNGAGAGAFMTTYRSGQRAVTDMFYPAARSPGTPRLHFLRSHGRRFPHMGSIHHPAILQRRHLLR